MLMLFRITPGDWNVQILTYPMVRIGHQRIVDLL